MIDNKLQNRFAAPYAKHEAWQGGHARVMFLQWLRHFLLNTHYAQSLVDSRETISLRCALT
jgi:hypothetical protein